MALPPTALTTLLDTASTPTAMYDVLRAHRCVSPIGLVVRARVVARIERAIDTWLQTSGAPGWTGPTAVDAVAAALLESRYLSRRGRRLNMLDPDRP